MDVIKTEDGKVESLPATPLELENIGSMSSELAQDILKIIAEVPSYPKQIAKRLKTHEQKIYYHIRNLEKAGIIRVALEESHHGATAKYYELTSPAFVLQLKKFEKTGDIFKEKMEGLDPFVRDGQLNAIIVIGSPHSHGPERSKSTDGYYGIDLALFLGTFMSYIPKERVKLDTEIRRSDLNDNLILLGGPAVNKTMEKFNALLPIKFEKRERWGLNSSLTKKRYEGTEVGLISITENRFAKDKKVLLIAGVRYAGTRAATLGFTKKFGEFLKGNKKKPKIKARVVEGVDADSDGIIDDVEFLE